jgi:hypothetical protein
VETGTYLRVFWRYLSASSSGLKSRLNSVMVIRKRKAVKMVFKNIVACRPVAKWWLCKQRPLLGNGHNRFVTSINWVLWSCVLYAVHASATWRNNRTLGIGVFCAARAKVLTSRTSLEFSQLWDSRQPERTWAQKMRKLRRWKPLPGDSRWRYSIARRLSVCCSGL